MKHIWAITLFYVVYLHYNKQASKIVNVLKVFWSLKKKNDFSMKANLKTFQC